MIEFYFWSTIHDSWVQCTQDEYMRKHYGKSFTRIVEVQDDMYGTDVAGSSRPAADVQPRSASR